MDKASTLLVIGIIVLTALPFIIFDVFKKMKKKKFWKNYIYLSEKANLKFSQKEVWNNCYAIGIDSDSMKLFYFNKNDDKEDGTLIDLAEVEKCRIVNTDRHLKGMNINNNIANRLELVFTYHNSGIPEKGLEFYMNTEFMPTTDDFAQAENWLKIVNSYLKPR
jgi:hypothetical protein